MISILDLFKKSVAEQDIDFSYFECEDSVEAALIYLDNHPNCTLEEYEEWLSHRENAIKEIKEMD